jgi:hypothetical protein
MSIAFEVYQLSHTHTQSVKGREKYYSRKLIKFQATFFLFKT